MTPYDELRKHREVLAKRIRETNKALRRGWPDRSRDAFEVCKAAFGQEDGRIVLRRTDRDEIRLAFGPTSWLLNVFAYDGVEYIVVDWHNGVTGYAATLTPGSRLYTSGVRTYFPPTPERGACPHWEQKGT